MSNSENIKGVPLKCGALIKILSIISIVCAVLNKSVLFFGYELKLWDDGDIRRGEYILKFEMTNFKNIIFSMIFIIPYVMLIIYIFRFYNKLKGTIVVPIIFVISLLKILLYGLWGTFFITYIYEKNLPYYALGESNGFYNDLKIMSFIAFIPVTIFAFFRFKKKLFAVISMVICILYNIVGFVGYFIYMPRYLDKYLYCCTDFLGLFGETLFLIVLLLFILNNKIPSISYAWLNSNKNSIKSISAENQLNLLQEKLELNIITEEEYQTQRAEIISKL